MKAEQQRVVSKVKDLKGLAPGYYIVTGEASAELSRQTAEALTKQFASKKKR